MLVEPGLYAASSTELLERLRELPETVPSAMVIGHNPGLQDLALRLVGSGDRVFRRQLREKFPTAALVRLALGETPWRDLGPRQATLIAYVRPRQLP